MFLVAFVFPHWLHETSTWETSFSAISCPHHLCHFTWRHVAMIFDNFIISASWQARCIQMQLIHWFSLYTSAIARSLSAWNMAEGGSGSADISLSMGIVWEEVKKDRFKTIGSACIKRYPSSPKKSPLDPKAASVEQKEYVCVLATTSEVVSKADLTSSKKFWVQFSSDKLWGKFSLDNVEVMEMRPSNEASSLTLFPIKSSLRQTQSSRLILEDDWTPNRSQPCYQAQSKTEVKDTKNELICYVLVEDVSTGKFRSACYFLSVDERGSYYLHPHGNKAIRKKLGDFQSTEKPKGSVILNEDKYVVGFLAFGDTNEIHPSFLPDNLQGMLLLEVNSNSRRLSLSLFTLLLNKLIQPGLALISRGKCGSPLIKVTLTEMSVSNLRHAFTLN